MMSVEPRIWQDSRECQQCSATQREEEPRSLQCLYFQYSAAVYLYKQVERGHESIYVF